uniref:Hypotheticial protein n=1 Tax=Schistosoma japonicum TaxID=6182 RepID=C1LED1_SCHJA|nr:hypotheticial protein [Schistosoma japonicum]
MAEKIVKKENAKISQSKNSTKRKNFERQQFPYLDLCPRKKQSYLNSISRIHKGRLLIEMKKEQTIVKLPFPSKRVKFRPLRCKSVSQCSNPPCNSSCCNSKHNGRFPSLPENRLVFTKNGNISVQRNKRTTPSAAYVDLLNLPPIPLNLKMTKSFISNQIYCACPFKSRTTVITDKHLDLIIPQANQTTPDLGLYFSYAVIFPVPYKTKHNIPTCDAYSDS